MGGGVQQHVQGQRCPHPCYRAPPSHTWQQNLDDSKEDPTRAVLPELLGCWMTDPCVPHGLSCTPVSVLLPSVQWSTLVLLPVRKKDLTASLVGFSIWNWRRCHLLLCLRQQHVLVSPEKDRMKLSPYSGAWTVR